MRKSILLFIAACLLPQMGNAQMGSATPTFEQRKEAVVQILKQNVANGLPGAAIAFSSANGDWSYSEGMANLETHEPLTNAHLHYLQSVSKMYMAVAIMKLSEEGKIGLNDNINKYLESIGALRGRNITVKMLLNHTSGIVDYAHDQRFCAFVMQDLGKTFTQQDCVNYVKNQPLNFAPGTDYAYSNTNYVLLSMIADKVTGDHVKYMSRELFKPLGLTQTVYLTKHNWKSLPIVDTYWDVLNIEKPINNTNIQKVNVASMRGDDGIVSSTNDAVRFMKALVQGKILKPETMNQMQEWVVKDGNNRYGARAYLL
jgi:D-alanyl-D-alanine carboxypeptidase